ncbi:RNA-binding S4 domain-containing protein [Streptomyces fuscigenes]|uniref:RNA-binding S4 domain-containing protein n=1 Tax=Streptomyces fuscigenes TaxID=1528880 RepID=UPI001F1A6D64|nr:RNA-binding S4 domain-containing protein [Streptomyces fuscigenes]MCF3961822.1 RNA-binding S4 domain-containing protein [Streptomyces fuscigenes]
MPADDRHEADEPRHEPPQTTAPADPARAAAPPDVEATAPDADPRSAGAGQPGPSVRVDSWVWSVRLTKTRSQAATACKGGHVRVNGERVKPSQPVKAGDEVRVWHAGRERRVVVTKLIKKRVGAPVAVTCYVDNSPPPPPREFTAPISVRPRGAGRPTKRDRRELDRLQGN